MAKKIAKKSGAKALKPSKAAKPAKAGVGAALKKAVKTIAKKVAAPAPAAKKADKAKASQPAKAAKTAKIIPAKAAKPAAKAAKEVPAAKGKKAAAPVVAAKGKKGAAPAAPAVEVKGKGKKGKEVVLEVAAKGAAALLGKEGKRKKGEESQSLSSKKRCREPGCDLDFTMNVYCRMHYIKNWRKIKRKEAILASGQLNNYVEELVNKYPDKYLEVIRQDLATEKDWAKVVTDLELESAEEEGVSDEEADAAPEVRSTGAGREFDDDNDSF